MDKRQLKSKNILHRQLFSSSQTSTKTVNESIKVNSIGRSVSAAEGLPVSRKRKNSETEENSSLSSSPTSIKSRSKKRRNVKERSDESSDSEEEVFSPKRPVSVSGARLEREKYDKFAKPSISNDSSSIKRIAGKSAKGATNEQKNSNKGSYIRGVLEALDKSPSKLSQSSNCSIDKYRNVNLRTPMRSRLEKHLSKITALRKNEPTSHNKKLKKSNDSVKNISVKSVSNKSYVSNNSSDSDISKKNSEDEMSLPDIDSPLAKKSTQEYKDKRHLKTSSPNLNKKNGHHKSQLNTIKNQGEKNIDIPELSPIKNLHSPEKSKLNTQKNASDQNQNSSKIVNFLNSMGITLYSNDCLPVADSDPREIIYKIKELLKKDSIDMEELIVSWYNYIDDEENLKKSILELTVENRTGISIYSKAISISRLLLQVPQFHVQVLNSLFKKLIDAIITTESSDDVPWASEMLQQFRFLEILTDPDLLMSLLEELLNSSPEWFQREIIIFIPDIIIDSQHCATSELLFNLLSKNSDLTSIILDCMSNLTFSKDYSEKLREQMLELLKTDFDKSAMPSITRFLLTDCSTEQTALKSLKVLRVTDLSPSPEENVEESFNNQALTINAIKICIQLFKEVAQASLTLIKTSSSEPVPFDIIITILLYQTITSKKKIIETTLYNHVKNGHYTKGLIYMLYNKFKQVVKDFQSTALHLAINFLKTNSTPHIEFGIEWVRNIFTSQSGAPYKQREIMEKLIILMGYSEKTVKNTLEVLCRMADDEIERQYLQNHASFLRCFVDKIDNLQFHEVSTMYHLLHGLCTQSELISNALNDDLSIIMQKQLCSSRVITKCKGVLGAVMAIKHLASSSETSDQAFELLKKTVTSLKNCIRSQALFYDQLGEILDSKTNINKEFLSSVTSYFEDKFINSCLVDEITDDNFAPKFGLNDSSMAENYYVNFKSDKCGALVPAFFKLLRICNLQLSGSLESINSVLGCPVLMPKDLDTPEPSTATYIIYSINWFRELISGFVTQEEKLLKEQVLKRLDCLMNLQGELLTMISMCEKRYEPPICYFHHFPAPQFVRVDMKLGKKGGKKSKKKNINDKSNVSGDKSLMLPEWEFWQIGSEMAVKNPAFFRKIDTKIIHLLDININTHSSKTASDSITIAQVYFIIKELFGVLENQPSESLIRDLIQLLPKICTKLKKIISNLRQEDNPYKKETVKLFLCFITTLFSWKEFQNAKYNNLLRDGLRTLAGMEKESNALLRSCKDLVAEAYKYFESLSDITTHISLAIALVNMCSCLMKHSTSFTEICKDRQAKMAHGFLCLDWDTERYGAQYNAAVKGLLNIWMDNESDPLKTVGSTLEWLTEEVTLLEKPQSQLRRLPSITKSNLYTLVKHLFTGLIKGVQLSLSKATKDPERIRIWLEAATSLDKLATICKANKNNIYLIFFLRYTAILYQTLLSSGMSLLEANIKYQTDEVLSVIKLFQKSGRFLRDIFCTAMKDKNVSLLKIIPLVKSRREKFIFRVKGILTANNSIGAFWMGNLLNKDIEGEQIESQSSDDITASSEVTSQINNADEVESEIFNSDSSDSDDDNDDNDDDDNDGHTDAENE